MCDNLTSPHVSFDVEACCQRQPEVGACCFNGDNGAAKQVVADPNSVKDADDRVGPPTNEHGWLAGHSVDSQSFRSFLSEDDNPVAASVVPRIKEAPRRESARNDVQKLGGCCHNWWWGNGSLGWIYDLHGRYLGGGAHLCVQGRRLNPD